MSPLKAIFKFKFELLLVLGVSLIYPKVTWADPESTRHSNVNVRIHAQDLAPSTVALTPGMTVVWINDSEVPVRVNFVSQGVSTTCKAPVGFQVDKKGVFVSKTLNKGQVASLCFLERDDYIYEVSYFQPAEGSEDLATENRKEVSYRLKGSVSVN